MARSAPTSLVLVSVPRSASRTGLVRPPSVPAKPNTHAPRPPRPPDCPASGVDKVNRVTNIGIMDRRTFVLLTGAASSALVRPLTTLDAPRPPGAAGSGRLRFELDEKRRWSLWYSSEGQPRPL